MRVRALLFFILTWSLLSCKNEPKKEYDPTIIDREKIDALFGHDLSHVRFNHLYVVLDSVSYAQLIRRSAWKNTYGAIDKGLPDFASVDSATASCYLRGHEHFIEFLGPNNDYGEPLGKSGIGFSLHNKGEHFHLGVTPKLKQSKTAYLSEFELVSMPLQKERTTWFKAFYSPSKGTALHTWYAFYNPAFLDGILHKKHIDYSREAFLRPSYDKERLFEGIKSITITCTVSDFERIGQEMRQLGCKLIKSDGNEITIASGDVTISISPSNTIEFSRIDHVTCGLNAENADSINLGNISITNTGTESIWNFENLYKNN